VDGEWGDSMKKWYMVIDVEKCEDCNNCFLSCKDEHVDNRWPGYTCEQPRHGHRWMNIMRKERGQYPFIDVAYLPVPCMHCDNAPCVKAAKDGAVYKRDDGTVIIDPEKAKGQTDLLKACPYNAIYLNEDNKTPQKCTFCAHLLDQGWKQPRCVQVCPTGAMRFIKAEDGEFAAMVEVEGLEILYPAFKTRPRVYYKNLYRFEKCFIGGSVAVIADSVTDCVPGARVFLKKGSETIVQTETDAFGDFKFDGIEENSGEYTIEILSEARPRKVLAVMVEKSINLGTIIL
jgi:Fe-S-cluster-containing dehydrogenase component